MFAFNLRRIYCVCDKIIVRTLRNRRIEVSGPNPGLDKRVTAFRDEGIPILDDAEEFIEQSESDFYKDDSYNAHLTESLAGKHELRHKIIKEKYFKENMPNLLTWSEKEQIRHLAMSQPEEWTPERIAESFPVTAAVAKKLLKYPWKPATEARIARHDASAMRNWKELKENTLDIPKNLREHFLKFSERSIPPLNQKSVKPDAMMEKMGEFEKIIQRCAEKQENKESDNTELTLQSDSDKYKQNTEDNDKRRITLDEMAVKIKNRLESGKAIDLPDQIMLSAINSNKSKEVSAQTLSTEIDLHDEKPHKNEITTYKEPEEKQTNIMEYPERIRIPKKAYKKGATYKVNDCYYDDDGRFLYRVLGMSN